MQRGRNLFLGMLAVAATLSLGLSSTANAAVPGWQEKSVNEGTPGNSRVDGDKIIIQGSGNDTWERNDGFYVVYKPLKGDGSVTTKLLDAEEGSEWSKIGVMIRNDLDDVAAAVSENHMTSTHGVENLMRGVANTPMSKDNKYTINGGADVAPRQFPMWLKIERRGDRVQQLISLDGNFWYPGTRPAKIQLKEEAVAGLFVCSHDDGALLTGTFDLAASDVSNTLLKPEQVSPAQPDPVVVTAGNNSALLTWDRVNHLGVEASGYTIYKAVATSGSYEDLQFTKIADLAADKTSYLDETAKNGEIAVYQVRTVVTVGDKKLESDTINDRMLYVTAAPAPPIQIGNMAFNHVHLDGLGEGDISSSPGSSAIDSNGVLTIKASGRDFWERGDGGAGTFTKVSGDFTLTARLLAAPQSEDGSEAPDWAKSGIMIRASTTGESRMVGLFGTGGNHGLQALRRAFDSGRGENLGSTGDSQEYPVWLRLQREGDKISLFTSKDGTTFTPYESNASTQLPGLARDVYVGMALTSHDNTVVAQTQMDNIKLEVKQGDSSTPPAQ